MKSFLKNILLFFLPLIGVLIIFELLLRYIPNDYAYKKQYLDKNSKNIEVLFLGTSHILNGINPEYMRYNGFNAANVSQSLKYDLMILEKYKNDWNSLKYIVIPIDYFSLYHQLEVGTEAWRVKNYNVYYGMGPVFGISENTEILSNKLERNIARAKLFYFEDISDKGCNKLGWRESPQHEDSLQLIRSGEIAAKRHTIKNYPGINYEQFFPENCSIINNIISFAKNKKVKVIFFTCPVYKSYLQHLDKEQSGNTANAIAKFVKENPGSIYLNLSDDPDFGTNDFADADHLNSNGAKRLTTKIDSIISSSKDLP